MMQMQFSWADIKICLNSVDTGLFLYIDFFGGISVASRRGAWAIFPGAQPTEQPRRVPRLADRGITFS